MGPVAEFGLEPIDDMSIVGGYESRTERVSLQPQLRLAHVTAQIH